MEKKIREKYYRWLSQKRENLDELANNLSPVDMCSLLKTMLDKGMSFSWEEEESDS